MENKLDSMKYYQVVAMCGHVGKHHYLAISFAVKARNVHQAAQITRQFPRVKHTKKDAIISCKEISFEKYLTLLSNNRSDPFLICHNHRDQMLIPHFEERVLSYSFSKKRKATFESREERICYELRKEKSVLISAEKCCCD